MTANASMPAVRQKCTFGNMAESVALCKSSYFTQKQQIYNHSKVMS